MNNEFNNFEDDNGFSTSNGTDINTDKQEGNNHVEDVIHDANYQVATDTTEVKKKKRKKGNGVAKYILVTLIVSLITSSGAALITYNMVKNNLASDKNSSVSQAPPTFATEDGSLTKSEIYDRVSPAVVTVSTKSVASSGYYFQQEVEGIGSGFIINEDGYILTNYHVIENAQEVSVILSNNNEVKAKVINYDSNKDIAMLKIVDKVEVPGIVELGDSDALKPGEEVIAIGTPISKEFSQTTTSGIISAINRSVETSSGVQTNLLQTDAAINPGNSGGPLVNTLGQVIGINTLKVGDGAENLGFSIPINDIKGSIEELSKPILNLGIAVREITEDVIKQSNLSLEEGLYVVRVEEFSSAEKAGIKGGDLITHFDGKRVKTFAELQELKNKKNEGDVVKITVNRDGKSIDLELTLAASN